MRALAVVALAVSLPACQSGPSGPSQPTAPAPPATPTPPPEGPLSGTWIGLSSEEMGLITFSATRNDFCENHYDWEGRLSHQGSRLTGTMTSRFAGADCVSGGRRYQVPPSAVGDAPVTHQLALTVHEPSGLSITWADWVATVGGAAVEVNTDLTGSYTPNTIVLAGDRTQGRDSWWLTFRLRRRS